MSRRAVTALVLLSLAVVLVATGIYVRRNRPTTTLTLTEVQGTVKVTGPDAREQQATPGLAIDPRDRVATGDASRAVLEVGAQTRIRLGPVSSVRVDEVDEDGVQIELEEGALHATVRPDSAPVRLSNRGRQALITDGDVSMGVGSDDMLLLEATRGDAMLGGIVGAPILEQGQRLVVGKGEHVEIGKIPQNLLLAVQWPDKPRTRDQTVTLPGKTEPGALVRVEGSAGVQETHADAQGHFEVQLPLYEGENPVHVQATDLLGHEIQDKGVLERDQSGPTFRGGVEYGP